MGAWNSCGPGPETQRRIFWGLLAVSLVSSVFLVTKEWAFAREVHKLTPILAELVPSSCVPNPQNDGVYVHLECPVRNSSTFYPPSNFARNISSFHGVFFEIKAEMFQITRSSRLFSSSSRGEWVDHLVPDSAWSWLDGSRNPAFFPQVPGVGRQLASGLRAGGYSLPGSLSDFFREKQQLALQDDGSYTPNLSRPPRKIDSQTTLVYENFLYTGNPLSPQVGDVRVSFWGSKSSHVSLIGKQVKGYFGSGRTILDAPADVRNGEPMIILAEGDYGPRSLIEHRLTQLGFPASFVWTWRSVGFVSLFLLFLASNAVITGAGEQSSLPHWARAIVAALLALSCILLESAAGWWAVERAAARRLSTIAILSAIAALAFRLLIPRFISKGEPAAAPAGGKYYDLGISLQMPKAASGIAPRPVDTRNSPPPVEQKQGHVIRWTTTPALAPSPEDALKKHSVLGTTTFVQPPSTGLASGNSSYVPPPMLNGRKGSLTGPSMQKSASKSSI